ncbi:hypothetical protein SGPA1_30776 [Streptomyces misionensis JCM 4497]
MHRPGHAEHEPVRRRVRRAALAQRAGPRDLRGRSARRTTRARPTPNHPRHRSRCPCPQPARGARLLPVPGGRTARPASPPGPQTRLRFLITTPTTPAETRHVHHQGPRPGGHPRPGRPAPLPGG